MKEELKIVYLAPEELTPYENNTRRHTPDDIDGIKRSIEENGFDDPIGIWGEKNIIVEGHGRLIAAKELHLEKVPCIRLDHLTDAQRRKYAIQHNRTAEGSEWDFSNLEEELAQLQLDGIDTSDLHFDELSVDGGAIPDNLDDDSEAKTNVICSINFSSTDKYEAVKDDLQRIADECEASLAVKMA